MSPSDRAIEQRIADRLLQCWPVQRWANVTVVVAVSGGLDSVCLLHLLDALRPGAARGRLIVGHFDHAVRTASQEDAHFVAELARSLQLPCEIGRAAPDQAEDEAALRTARLAFLSDLVRRRGGRYLVMAHHADDQAETVLHRILRGSGPRGACGMQPFRDLDAETVLVRPLLDVPRRWLSEYARDRQLSYRTDPSNEETNYTRNWLRHSVLPELRHRYPGVDGALQRFADTLGQERQLGLQWARYLMDAAVVSHTDRVCLRGDVLRGIPANVLFELFALLWQQRAWPQRAMTADHWQRLIDAVGNERNEPFCLPGDIQVRRSGVDFLLERLDRTR